ncbi:hypothetical protein FB567DRAFT_462224 [Paraphoma chrysanthemicola]|uniref:Beta-glucuronidase C-terminal domain-containing protein n=1 Tax=Paraphoma chrysanthemicola TaxID=798071 RepID=A0A8K0REN7_9PLEO|nr:hypothetical protein FB567DRAFT_462224 [Paraphoma chrysanthemicola]
MARELCLSSILSLVTLSAGLKFSIPQTVPSNASAQLTAAPVGASFEFFTWPGYMNDVPATKTCLQNLQTLTGTWPPIRIGGTTQDRATYNASSNESVTYSVSDPKDAPASLTFGPPFIDLASKYSGSVILGLNRRLNDLSNTISAAKAVVSSMRNLYAIELGNEPNFFTSSDPIARGASWTAAADRSSEIFWQDAVCGNLSASNLISAGVYFGTSPISIQALASQEGDANTYVKDYCSHNYPQSASTANLANLMNHAQIKTQIKPFAAEAAAAKNQGRPHIFGETNSATQGGGGISPTFGAGLWILDYVIQSVLQGTQALYFHQGTIGNCQYCWWGKYDMGSPYYGAYFATMALAKADNIAPLDDGTTAYAAYAIYQAGKPIRILLYNSDYYTSGTRLEQTYTLSGFSNPVVTAKRLSAASATSRVDQGSNPTVAGQTFANGTCRISGTQNLESTPISAGQATFTVAASEALLDQEVCDMIINALQAHWIWVPDWIDSSSYNTAGRLVNFIRTFNLDAIPTRAIIHCSADTRYKLLINGKRVVIGPVRSSPGIWYYDSLDIAEHLKIGSNEVRFLVLRYFAATRSAMPFARTAYPGLTVIGGVDTTGASFIDLGTGDDWKAKVDESVQYPAGLVDDVFLHIYERVKPKPGASLVSTKNYGIKTLNGELAPWRLQPRVIPMPEQSNVVIHTVRPFTDSVSEQEWYKYFSGDETLELSAGSSHTLDIQAHVHSTAFLQWKLKASSASSHVKLKVIYSEGYELEPRSYPFFRTKTDRLDAASGRIIGPCDEVDLDIPSSEIVTYEPFWFRTFRIIRVEITVGSAPIELVSFSATQINYPLKVKAELEQPGDPQSKQIWDVSIRTMRNCMFDGYSDCPFYEQLQYGGDSYPVGLFHYLISGDDRLMRQAITNFASSITPEGLTQSRFPSQVPQIIVGFSLYWILAISKHHLFFGDTAYTKSLLPRIDGVLDFYDRHIDDLGLVSGFPEDVWQFVDWVTTWGATEAHPDKGVPTSGRKTNRHTFFSLLYAHVLKEAAELVRIVGRPGHAAEYEIRAEHVLDAVRTHCYDGKFFTDSTANIADDSAYSQHCQVFAVIAGAAESDDQVRLLTASRTDARFSKCSYFMQFYALRAYAIVGDDVYDSVWPTIWNPWRKMLANNMTTWEEDDVRQRSDCHAWGSVPIYEYCTELAGVQPVAPKCSKILFKPRLHLSDAITAKVCLGRNNVATVEWKTMSNGTTQVKLELTDPVEVVSQLPHGTRVEHGRIRRLKLEYRR